MIEFLTEYWYLYILASLAGVGSSFWLGRLNRARLARDAERDRIEELERIDEINQQLGGRDG